MRENTGRRGGLAQIPRKGRAAARREAQQGRAGPHEGAQPGRTAVCGVQALHSRDRSQVHKVLGLWCLGHYVVHIHRGIWSADPTGGLAGLGGAVAGAAARLSLSSIKFHVPENASPKPMIWQGRMQHVLALRSFVCSASLHVLRVTGAGGDRRVYGCPRVIDRGGRRDRPLRRIRRATTGRSLLGRRLTGYDRRFKFFYAYCQWMATLGCLANGNRSGRSAARCPPARVAAGDVGAQGPADGAATTSSTRRRSACRSSSVFRRRGQRLRRASRRWRAGRTDTPSNRRRVGARAYAAASATAPRAFAAACVPCPDAGRLRKPVCKEAPRPRAGSGLWAPVLLGRAGGGPRGIPGLPVNL